MSAHPFALSYWPVVLYIELRSTTSWAHSPLYFHWFRARHITEKGWIPVRTPRSLADRGKMFPKDVRVVIVVHLVIPIPTTAIFAMLSADTFTSASALASVPDCSGIEFSRPEPTLQTSQLGASLRSVSGLVSATDFRLHHMSDVLTDILYFTRL
ncbi:hypothetical protein F5Y06DRAFT_295610 [Hypoxylon sp. FL0890]|nr:hypothetical protein F5Y06DRAFT_295610 [Hypoxylon sp. FL0890]